MAKGLGAIMAEAKMAQTKQRLDQGLSILCPLCEQEMELNGAAWFCRSGKRRSDGSYAPCNLEALQGRFVNHDEDRWIDDWQGALLAAVVLEDENAPGGYAILGELRTVRGAFGRTNLTVCARSAHKDDLPQLIAAHGWTWAEWAEKE